MKVGIPVVLNDSDDYTDVAVYITVGRLDWKLGMTLEHETNRVYNADPECGVNPDGAYDVSPTPPPGVVVREFEKLRPVIRVMLESRMKKLSASIQGGVATLENGKKADLWKVQKTLVAAFQESGEQGFADAAQELSILTGQQVGPQDFPPPTAAGLKPYSAMVVREDGSSSYTFVWATDPVAAIWEAQRETWLADDPSPEELENQNLNKIREFYTVELLLEGHHPDILVNI